MPAADNYRYNVAFDNNSDVATSKSSAPPGRPITFLFEYTVEIIAYAHLQFFVLVIFETDQHTA